LNAADVMEGRYRLERLLGTGGMAEVWLAEDQRLARWVAVKVLREAFDETLDATTIAAFEREARVIARLQHPNIVAVYDAGTHEGRRYIVMEYVHGYSLRQLLETQGRLPEVEAIRYGMQVASALHYAHGQGVVHCDIKPENILITEHGVAKVADFGVAETLTRTLTPRQAQELLGTIAYLAPEVIEGSAPAASSDVYALALTLFEAIAGRTPFGGSTARAAIGQRLAAPAPPLRTFARGASPEVEAVLARSLALSPYDRYPGAEAFAQALRRVPPQRDTANLPVAAPPGRPPQLQQRHTTARVRRGAIAPPVDGNPVSGSAILLAVGVVLAALGIGVAAAIFLANRDDDNGGNSETPTPAPTQQQSPVATATPTRTSVSPTPSHTPAPSPTVQPTATRTPTRQPTPANTPPQGTVKPQPTTPAPTLTHQTPVVSPTQQ